MPLELPQDGRARHISLLSILWSDLQMTRLGIENDCGWAASGDVTGLCKMCLAIGKQIVADEADLGDGKPGEQL